MNREKRNMEGGGEEGEGDGGERSERRGDVP